jgi:hypothetical protein
MKWKFTHPDIAVRPDKRADLPHLAPEAGARLKLSRPNSGCFWRRLSSRGNTKNGIRAGLLAIENPSRRASPTQKWLLYHQGLMPEGRPAAAVDHRTRLHLNPFTSQTDKPVKIANIRHNIRLRSCARGTSQDGHAGFTCPFRPVLPVTARYNMMRSRRTAR